MLKILQAINSFINEIILWLATTIIAISHRSAIEKISDVTYHINNGKLTKI